jgi:hypothetical protein
MYKPRSSIIFFSRTGWTARPIARWVGRSSFTRSSIIAFIVWILRWGITTVGRVCYRRITASIVSSRWRITIPFS